MDRIIQFFKKMNLYNEAYFSKIQEKTKIYNFSYEEIKDFIGCYPIYNEKEEVIDFKMILPKIYSFCDELIYVHEYTHAFDLEDHSEIFPNIMEAYYICMYIHDVNLKLEMLSDMRRKIRHIEDISHRIGVQIKIMIMEENIYGIQSRNKRCYFKK